MAKKVKSVSDDPKGEHYKQICNMAGEVASAQLEWIDAKADTKDKKDLFDKLSDDLLGMIRGGPDWQQKLEFGEE